MDDFLKDYIKSHENIPLFDKNWRRKQGANDPRLIRESLLKCFRQDRKHRRARILIEEVCKRDLRADNYYIARRLWKDGSAKLTKDDFQNSANNYPQRIKNLCKTVRHRIKPVGYTITFHPSFTEIIRPK